MGFGDCGPLAPSVVAVEHLLYWAKGKDTLSHIWNETWTCSLNLSKIPGRVFPFVASSESDAALKTEGCLLSPPVVNELFTKAGESQVARSALGVPFSYRHWFNPASGRWVVLVGHPGSGEPLTSALWCRQPFG